MKSNLAAILLVLACLGLGAVLWEQNQKHADQTQSLDQTITSYSNNLTSLKGQLTVQGFARTNLEINLAATQSKASNDLAEVRAMLSTTSARLEKSQEDATAFSNHVTTLTSQLTEQLLARAQLETNLAFTERKAANELATVRADLSTTTASLEKSQAEAKAAAAAIAAANAAIAEKDKRISALESQNTELDKEASDLRISLTNIQAQIQAARKKLDAAEGDQQLLMAEWTKAQAQKEELEKKFSDLAVLKERVRTLRDNIAIDRRLDYIRRGLYDAGEQKAGDHMINPPVAGPAATNKSLDVELHQGGEIKLNPPASTNAPSARAPSASAPPARAPSARQAPDYGL
jgi:chromosome segregation ATPase